MKKILLVEDDVILCGAMEEALKQAKYRVVTVGNGSDVLVLAKKEKPDLIILDLRLPKKSGEEALTELKSEPETKFIPVLVSTQKDDLESISRCSALGMQGYFIKSDYSLDSIVAEVKRALGDK
jgi:DNA-binding response OmpR family regulator